MIGSRLEAKRKMGQTTQPSGPVCVLLIVSAPHAFPVVVAPPAGVWRATRNCARARSCVLRWAVHGARSPAGKLVRLEAARLGSRWITSRQALQRFVEALTPRTGAAPPLPPRTPAKRRRASEQAAKTLENIGI